MLIDTLRDFARRIGSLDTPEEGEPVTELRVSCDGVEETLSLSPSAVTALKHALEDYADPRDAGSCDHCGSRRVDRNFICLDCGQPNGVFGQLLLEHSERYPGDPQALKGSQPDTPHGSTD